MWFETLSKLKSLRVHHKRMLNTFRTKRLVKLTTSACFETNSRRVGLCVNHKHFDRQRSNMQLGPSCQQTLLRRDGGSCIDIGVMLQKEVLLCLLVERSVRFAAHGLGQTSCASEHTKHEANRTSLAPLRPTWPTGQAWYHMLTAPDTMLSDFPTRGQQDKPGATDQQVEQHSEILTRRVCRHQPILLLST